MFDNKILVITGGTGSFGNAMVSRFIQSSLKEIRIFSRDEKKQDEMRKRYDNSKIKFYLGDVRDFRSVTNVMHDVNFVFHAAALKQVPSCEFYPMEAVKTNILGTDNVISAAIEASVERVIVLSTDKAVYPINAMGCSKALMEKVAISRAHSKADTIINVTRYGNVMGSRGSVIPLFIDQIKKDKPITITDKSMTRFMMTLDDAVDLVMFAFNQGKPGELFIQKAPAATIETLLQALLELFEVPHHIVNIIGTRHGEKRHEALLTREEYSKARDLDKFYCINPDLRDLNYTKFISKGSDIGDKVDDYTSENTTRLDLSSMKLLLMRLPLVLDQISDRNTYSEI